MLAKNLNDYMASVLAKSAADEQPRLAAEQRAPNRPRPVRTHAADGELLGFDSVPLAEALPDAETVRTPRSSAPICFDTPPRKDRP